MEEEPIKEKRENTCNEINIARAEVFSKKLYLKENLEYINKILHLIKKERKVISCLTFLKSNWLKNNDYDSQLKEATEQLKDLLEVYKITILKRKLLKNKFKQAQRKLAKKQKRIKDFDKKYFPKED